MRSLVFPEVVLLFAAALLLSWEGAREWVVDFAPVYPAVYVIGAIQCWRFHRSRLLYAMVAIAMSDRILLHYAAGEAAATGTGLIVFHVVAFLLPLNLLAIATLPERGPLTIRGIIQWAVIFVQPAIVVRLLSSERVVGLLEKTIADPSLFGWTALSDLTLLVVGVAVLVLGARAFVERTAERRAFFGIILAIFLALNGGQAGLQSTTYLAAGGLMMVVAVIDTSYRLAFMDALTGLPTRRSFFDSLEQMVGHYTLAMVDVDHFKTFNDQHGHDVGDQVLNMVASLLGQVTGGGKAYRYGGEEFAIVFSGKVVEETQPHLEQLRATIAGKVFTIRGRKRPRKKPEHPQPAAGLRKTLRVSVSIGAADNTNPKETSEDVIKAADQQLYRAKDTGRNKVAIRARPSI